MASLGPPRGCASMIVWDSSDNIYWLLRTALCQALHNEVRVSRNRTFILCSVPYLWNVCIQLWDVSSVIAPILQGKKLRFREAKSLGQDERTSYWWRLYLRPSCSHSRAQNCNQRPVFVSQSVLHSPPGVKRERPVIDLVHCQWGLSLAMDYHKKIIWNVHLKFIYSNSC